MTPPVTNRHAIDQEIFQRGVRQTDACVRVLDLTDLPLKITPEEIEPCGLLRIPACPFLAFKHERPKHSEKTSDQSSDNDHLSPLRSRPPVRLDRLVQHLNHGSVLGLIYLGELVLLGEQLVK